jgi:hypothetical protein
VLVKQVTQLPPPPRGYNPSIPPSVEQIVLRCLAKNPDARFPTMIALREALLDPELYLRASPPMSPARSLAPGEVKVDAKTIMAYAAQEQQTRIGMAGAPLPLPAPPTTLPGNAGARTMISDGSLVPPKPVQAPPPEMVVPNQPKMNTMRIATPMGYSSRPPRKMWPIVLVFALLLGLGGGAFAVAYFGKTTPPGEGSDSTGSSSGSAGSAVAVQPTVDAAIVQLDAPSPTPVAADAAPVAPVPADAAPQKGSAAVVPTGATAVISIESKPPGAEVIGPDGKSLGKAPVKVTLPISDLPQEFELKLAGYKKKKKSIVVTGNAIVEVPLDRAASSGNRHQGSGGGDNGLMRPDDL